MRRANRLLVVLLAVLSLASDSRLHSQNTPGDETRKKAFDLFRQDRHIEVPPPFEELALTGCCT